MITMHHYPMRHAPQSSVTLTIFCVLALLGLASAAFAADAPTDRNDVVVDMATFTGDRKVIKAREGTVRVTLKGIVDQNSTRGHRLRLEGESRYGSGTAKVQPIAENIHTYACQTFKAFRKQLEIGTDTPLKKVYYDLRSPQDDTATQEFYEKARAIIKKAAKGPTKFFHRQGDLILCDMVFNVPAEIATPRTQVVAPCYRESDLQDLMDLLVTAAKLYIKTVDQAREDVEQERALQKAAAQP
ncbi:MAG: hypothetical protein KAI66_27160 [Lentisphaeria bacterium]|nr:hypothetical protein [Lentisphaeria bacterium]